MSRNDEQRLSDILARIDAAKAAEAILVTAERAGTPALFNTAYDAILYDLVVIGEAVRALERDLRGQYPEVDWIAITGLRNILTHEYFRVSAEVVLQTLDSPLAQLRSACIAEIKSL